jgi:hypothetical protein
LCNDLGGSAILSHNLKKKNESTTPPAICPGPNLAYFSKVVTLKEMVAHIYGHDNILNDTPRSNMFIAELKMYVDHFRNEIKKAVLSLNENDIKYLNEYKKNLFDGIFYYENLIPKMVEETQEYRKNMSEELCGYKMELENLGVQHKEIFTSVD